MAEQKSKQQPRKFSPASLTREQCEAVIEHYLGINPKYFLYESGQIKLNLWEMAREKQAEFDFHPHKVELNEIPEDEFNKRFKK
jgi:hypothetical protein